MLPLGGPVSGAMRRAAGDERNKILGETRIGVVNSEEYVMRQILTPVSSGVNTEVPWQKVIRVSANDYKKFKKLGKQFESDMGVMVLRLLTFFIATIAVGIYFLFYNNMLGWAVMVVMLAAISCDAFHTRNRLFRELHCRCEQLLTKYGDIKPDDVFDSFGASNKSSHILLPEEKGEPK